MRVRRGVVRALAVLAMCAAAALVRAESTGAEPLYPIFEGGHWGLIDASGKIVLPARFDQVAKWPSGWNPGGYPASVMAAAEISGSKPIRESVIPVRLNGQAALATRDGRVFAVGRYEEIAGQFSEGRIRVRAGGRYGFADERGELAVPALFEDTRSFESGFAFVKSGNRWGVIDRDGRTVVPPSWDELDESPGDRLATVRVGKLWGVVERSGNVAVTVRYEHIGRPVPPLIFAVDAGRPLYIHPDGSPAFQLECPRGKARGYPFFEKTSAIVSCGDRWGLIDTQGRFLLGPTWNDILPFSDGRAVVKSDRKAGVIDNTGRFVLPLGNLNLFGFDHGMGLIQGPDSKVGFIDINGRIAIPPAFEWAGRFNDGIAAARVGGKGGYIDRTGAWVIQPQFWSVSSFDGPLATVETPVTRDTKEVAYIDRSGKTVHRMRFSGYVYDDQLLREFQ